jgi:hypothetical protein
MLPRPSRGDGPRESGEGRSERREPQLDPRFDDPMTEQGQRAHGLYLGGTFVEQLGAAGVISAVQNAHMNAVVLDLKDAEGRIHHDTHIPELRSGRTGWLGDTAALVETLHDNDIYVIARIVCFADRRLPELAPARGIQHFRNHSRLWVSWGTGGTWLDPYNPENHAMVVALAREAEGLGFDEVQLDYVRFPVDEGVQYAHYPRETQEERARVLVRLLRAVDDAVHIPIGVDVFGLTVFRDGDPSGLGQDLEAWTRHVEVFTPMLYMNSMRAWGRPGDDRTFRLIFAGIANLRRRVGRRPVIRPFLQAFAQGADSFDETFIADQVRAARRGRADGFLFWHPGHTYQMVRRAFRTEARHLLPFPIPHAVIRARSTEP